MVRRPPCTAVPSRSAWWTDGQVVLNDDGLAVKDEAPARVRVEQVENDVHGIDEAGTELLEASIPLSIPVRVGDDDAVHRADYARDRRAAPFTPTRAVSFGLTLGT